MSNILPLRGPRAEPVQFTLFEEDDPAYTNTIDLIDGAPRWVIYTDRDKGHGERYLASVERVFVHNHKQYALTLRPARIRAADGTEREEYPGTREQLVEQVIRKIATAPDRLKERDGDICLQFSINEVRNELTRRNHHLRFDEIKESLNILHGAIIEIRRIDENGTSKVISSSAFPQISFAQNGTEYTESTLQFNWLVVEAIKRLQFRQLNYDTIMRLKDPIAMWLFNSLSHRALYGGENGKVQQFTAMDIQRDCGLTVWKAQRNMLARITRGVEALKAHGVIESYEEAPIKGGRKKLDIEYTMIMSGTFLDEMKRSQGRAVANIEDYRAVTGGDPTSFEARLDAPKRQKLRGLKSRRQIA